MYAITGPLTHKQTLLLLGGGVLESEQGPEKLDRPLKVHRTAWSSLGTGPGQD